MIIDRPDTTKIPKICDHCKKEIVGYFVMSGKGKKSTCVCEKCFDGMKKQ